MALLGAQALVQLHRVAHVPHGPGHGPATGAFATAFGSLEAGALADVFGEHDCASFDHAGTADAPLPFVAVLATLPRSDRAATPPRSPILAAEAAGFLARGPPLLLSS